MRLRTIHIIGLGAAVLAAAAFAAETLTYRYDGRGRLIRVERSGTVNEVNTVYHYDDADSRTNKTTTIPPP